MSLEHSGCFGESVLTGRRRQATHIAASWCETLVLTKEDLIGLFEKNPRSGKRIVKTLLAEVSRNPSLVRLESTSGAFGHCGLWTGGTQGETPAALDAVHNRVAANGLTRAQCAYHTEVLVALCCTTGSFQPKQCTGLHTPLECSARTCDEPRVRVPYRIGPTCALPHSAAAASLFQEKDEGTSIPSIASEAGRNKRDGGLSPEQVLAAAEERVKMLFDSLREDLAQSTSR